MATLFVSNLDDRVDERTLYEIMIQAGPVVEVYIPRDRDSKRHKGYAFAEYETEESANYALQLFSGLVTLHNRTVRFALSGGHKSSVAGKTLTTPTHRDNQTPHTTTNNTYGNHRQNHHH